MGWKSDHTLSWVLCLGLRKAEIEVLDRLHSHLQALPGMEEHLSSGRLWTGFISLTEKAMAPHSSTLVWKIPLMEEPGRLQSMGLLGVRHHWATSLSLFTFTHWRRKWHPLQCSASLFASWRPERKWKWKSFSRVWLFTKTRNREKKRKTAACSFHLQQSLGSGVLRLPWLVQSDLGFSLFWLTYYPLIKDLYTKNPFISAIFHWLEGDRSVHSHSRKGTTVSTHTQGKGVTQWHT